MLERAPTRLDWKAFRELTPETNTALLDISAAVKKTSLEPGLVELAKLRASQINGCAFCVHWHTVEARKLGESDDRLALVAAWRDAPAFSSRERAALTWTEALTEIAGRAVSDEIYADMGKHFSDQELAYLTGAIVTINAWNRIGVAYRFPVAVKTAAPAG